MNTSWRVCQRCLQKHCHDRHWTSSCGIWHWYWRELADVSGSQPNHAVALYCVRNLWRRDRRLREYIKAEKPHPNFCPYCLEHMLATQPKKGG